MKETKNTPETCMCYCEAKEEQAPITRVQIVGNAFIVTSALPFETIKFLEKYENNGLCLKRYDKDEEIEIFRINTGKTASISKCGITFVEPNKEGYAIATMLFPEKVQDKRQFIKDNYAKTLFLLAELEYNAKQVYAHIQNTLKNLDTLIKEF